MRVVLVSATDTKNEWLSDKNKGGRQSVYPGFHRKDGLKIIPDQDFKVSKIDWNLYEASLWQDFVWK